MKVAVEKSEAPKKKSQLKEVFIGGGLIKVPAKFGSAYKFFVSGETKRAEVNKIIEVCERGGQEYTAEKVNSNVGVLWVVYQKPDICVSEKTK